MCCKPVSSSTSRTAAWKTLSPASTPPFGKAVMSRSGSCSMVSATQSWSSCHRTTMPPAAWRTGTSVRRVYQVESIIEVYQSISACGNSTDFSVEPHFLVYPADGGALSHLNPVASRAEKRRVCGPEKVSQLKLGFTGTVQQRLRVTRKSGAGLVSQYPTVL